MVKKCLIAIAVVALLATTLQAVPNVPEGSVKRDPQTGGWPYHWDVTYDNLPICTFPVILEVGHFVQIKDCTELELRLIQVDCDNDIQASGVDNGDFPCYAGCVTFEARANFVAEFGYDFNVGDGHVDILTDYAFNWDSTDDNTITGDGSYQDVKLCMEAWNVELWNSQTPDDVVTVGEVTIDVKPPLSGGSGTGTGSWQDPSG